MATITTVANNKPRLLLFLIYACVILATTNQSTTTAHGKILKQCEAMDKLIKNGVSRSLVSPYVCIMKVESGFNTSKKTGPGHKASFSYGIFQINSYEWCNAYRIGGYCEAKCDDFLDDDISDDIKCAKLIAEKRGFKHWKKWERDCKQRLPNLQACFETNKRYVRDVGNIDGSGNFTTSSVE